MMNQQITQQLVNRIEEIIKERGDNSATVFRQYGVDYISISDVNCENGILELSYDNGSINIPSYEIERWDETVDQESNVTSIMVKAKYDTFEFDF